MTPAPATIVAIDVLPLRLRLREPFAVAYATQDHSDTVLVRLRTSDGTEGWGEATPDEHVTGETYAAALAAQKAPTM